MSNPSIVIIPRETLERAFFASQALSLTGFPAEKINELLDAARVHPQIQEAVQEMVNTTVLGKVSLDELLGTLADSEEDEDA